MKHWIGIAIALALAACNKPAVDDCRAAITNMQKLLGTDNLNKDIEGEVRMCKGGSTKEAVECAMKAKTVEELKACDFMTKKK